MSALLTHAMRIAIHTEAGNVTMDLTDEPNVIGSRIAFTPDQAESLAAEILMAAEKARSLFVAEIA
jgi:hypothetical protein